VFGKLNIFNRATQLNALFKVTCAVPGVTGFITVETLLLIDF